MGELLPCLLFQPKMPEDKGTGVQTAWKLLRFVCPPHWCSLTTFLQDPPVPNQQTSHMAPGHAASRRYPFPDTPFCREKLALIQVLFLRALIQVQLHFAHLSMVSGKVHGAKYLADMGGCFLDLLNIGPLARQPLGNVCFWFILFVMNLHNL